MTIKRKNAKNDPDINLANGQLCIGSENKFIKSLIHSFIQIGFAGYNTTI